MLDGIGHPVNVCALLPAATAASMSGEPITVAQEQDLVNAFSSAGEIPAKYNIGAFVTSAFSDSVTGKWTTATTTKKKK